ncbi:transposable element Tc1 transposase [Trichonephila clavipes]|nr:transposable element Tc1 transposase [Trichonephila clavipes]
MPHRRNRAHYKQLSEFERGRIIGLKEARWANWRIVCSSYGSNDESRFQLCLDDNRRRVWRRPGQRADPAFTIARHTGTQPGVMIWVAISFDSRTTLVVIRGTLTRTATAGSDVVQSGRPIFDDFFQHLWPYIGNNTANVVFQMVKRLLVIQID